MTYANPSMNQLVKRFGWQDDDPGNDLQALYMCWIYGVSVEKLARFLHVSITTMKRLLRRVYGVNATSLFHKSLLRSLAEDYPADNLVQVWIENNLMLCEPPKSYVATSSTSLPIKPIFGASHKSQKSLDNISKHEFKTLTDPEVLDRLGVRPSNGKKVVVTMSEWY